MSPICTMFRQSYLLFLRRQRTWIDVYPSKIFFVNPWSAACQNSLSFTLFLNLLNSCPLSQWCHPTILSSITHFPSCPESFPESRSFSTSQLSHHVPKGGFSFNTSLSNAYLGLISFKNDWFDLLGVSKGLSRIFSSTTVWKHQFLGTQPSWWCNSLIHAWLLEKFTYLHCPY